MSGSNIAPVKWAQRKDSLYVTISLADVKDHSIKLTERKITFSGVSGGQAYHLDLELFKEIESEGSIWNVLPASIQMKINKKDKEGEFWPRLLLDKVQEKTNVKVDWDKYVDEDEAEGKDFDTGALDGGMDFGGMGGMGGMPGGMGGMGGMDFSKMMAGMGGMGGMGGMPGGMGGMDFGGEDEGEEGEEGDSDDEGLPDLESADAPTEA